MLFIGKARQGNSFTIMYLLSIIHDTPIMNSKKRSNSLIDLPIKNSVFNILIF